MTVNDIVLPEFIGTKEQIQKREQYYESRVNEVYPNLELISQEVYQVLIQRIKEGDRGAIDELYAKTLSLQVEKIKKIYIKYDIEDVIPFEEGLSSGLLAFHLKLLKNAEWITNLTYFIKQYISLTMLRKVKRDYIKNISRNREIELMPPKSIGYIIDKKMSEKAEEENYRKQDALNLIDKSFSKITERDSLVVQMYYGVGEFERTTPDEIAQEFNISKTRVFQIVHNYLTRVQNREGKKYKDFILN